MCLKLFIHSTQYSIECIQLYYYLELHLVLEFNRLMFKFPLTYSTINLLVLHLYFNNLKSFRHDRIFAIIII